MESLLLVGWAVQHETYQAELTANADSLSSPFPVPRERLGAGSWCTRHDEQTALLFVAHKVGPLKIAMWKLL